MVSNSKNSGKPTISAVEVYGKPYFETASEYRIAMALGLECSRRGILLDFTGMRTKAPLNSPYYASVKNYLIENGLVLGLSKTEEVDITFEGKDLSYLDTPDLFKLVTLSGGGEVLRWSNNYAKEVLGAKYNDLMGYGQMPFVFVEMACKHILDYLLGYTTTPLEFRLDRFTTTATANYLNICSFLASMPRYGAMVSVIPDKSAPIDMSLSLFQYDAINSDFNKFFSVEEKLGILEQKGIRDGMIAILFDRKGLNKSNSLGQIEMAHVVRVDEIVDDKLYLTHLRAMRTHEELIYDYDTIPEEHKHFYTDLLEPYNSVIYSSEIDLRDCGIGDHFYREKHIIDTISVVDLVDKMVSPNGGVGIQGDILDVAYTVSISEADAIYYTLMQNDAPFNSKMFRDFYFNGGKGTWELLQEEYAEANSP